MLKGFKDFVLRGNIVELAIAVVIGSAFAALVTAFTKGIISPIIALFGGNSVNGFAFKLNSKNDATLVDLGLVITAAITFLITAAVVYFVFVVPMNRINARLRRGKEEELEQAPTDVQLLIEIRDLLLAQAGPAAPASSPVAAGGDQPGLPPAR